MGRQVEVGTTDKGVTIYQAERAYAISRSFRPYIVVSPECSKSKRAMWHSNVRVYLKGGDLEGAKECWCSSKKVVIIENYSLLKKSKQVLSNRQWIENPYKR